MIPERFAPVLFGFILSGLMSFVVSGISTLKVRDSFYFSFLINSLRRLPLFQTNVTRRRSKVFHHLYGTNTAHCLLHRPSCYLPPGPCPGHLVALPKSFRNRIHNQFRMTT
jgi:hypothetical protein